MLGDATPQDAAATDADAVAALTLGLTASWLPPERRVGELRAATCPVGASAAVRALERRRENDPVGVARALDLLTEAYPGCDRSGAR